MLRELVRLVLIILLGAGVLLALVWMGQRRLIYFPFGVVPSPAEAGLPWAEPVAITTDDGLTLHGWYVGPRVASAGWTVIVFNGNAGHRAFRAPLAAALAARGIATLLFDYRGYGGNPGSPSEEGLARDARAAREWLDTQHDAATRRVAYFGESLGAAVAVRLAIERPPDALILRSPFTTLADVGGYHYPFLPVRWLLRDRYPSVNHIAQLRCPVLVIAGDRDRIIPVSQSEQLYQRAPSPKRLVIVPGADHNDADLLAGRLLLQAVSEFLLTGP